MKSIVRRLSILVIIPLAVRSAENVLTLAKTGYVPSEKILELVRKPQGGIRVIEQLEQWHRSDDLNAADFDYVLKNIKIEQKFPLLHAAFDDYWGNRYKLKILIDLIHKAGLQIDTYIDILDRYGQTALAFALRRDRCFLSEEEKKGEEDQALLLLDNGANPNVSCCEGLYYSIPVLHVAVWRRCQNLVETLVEKGAEINSGPCFTSELYEMAGEKYMDIPKSLLDVAVDRASVRLYASIHGYKDKEHTAHRTSIAIMRFLIANGAKTYSELYLESKEKREAAEREERAELEVSKAIDMVVDTELTVDVSVHE